MLIIQALVRLIYNRFGHFLVFLLAIGVIFNGVSSINNWIAIPIVVIMVTVEMIIAVVVEFNEGPETLLIKFLSRFVKLDVLGATIVIIFYIAGCNNWLNVVN